jgi:hypothetical protein
MTLYRRLTAAATGAVMLAAGAAYGQSLSFWPAPETAAPAGGGTPRRGEIVVVGSQLEEERAIGPYDKPEYIRQRRFTTTRVYLQTDPGEVEFEQWLEIRQPKDRHKDTETRLRQEFEIGIAEHLQLDLYVLTEHIRDGVHSEFGFRGWSAEVRYAPWKWNAVFGNPTLYFEYILMNGEADTIEPKLLLGGELGPGWHWGLNLVYERELANRDDANEEYKLTAGLSYTLIDQKLSLGPEVELVYEAEREKAGGVAEVERSRQVHVGPSLQWRPRPTVHLDLVPLFGVTGESKRMKTFIVFGLKF